MAKKKKKRDNKNNPFNPWISKFSRINIKPSKPAICAQCGHEGIPMAVHPRSKTTIKFCSFECGKVYLTSRSLPKSDKFIKDPDYADYEY